jgi:hypothetical protein
MGSLKQHLPYSWLQTPAEHKESWENGRKQDLSPFISCRECQLKKDTVLTESCCFLWFFQDSLLSTGVCKHVSGRCRPCPPTYLAILSLTGVGYDFRFKNICLYVQTDMLGGVIVSLWAEVSLRAVNYSLNTIVRTKSTFIRVFIAICRPPSAVLRNKQSPPYFV